MHILIFWKLLFSGPYSVWSKKLSQLFFRQAILKLFLNQACYMKFNFQEFEKIDIFVKLNFKTFRQQQIDDRKY